MEVKIAKKHFKEGNKRFLKHINIQKMAFIVSNWNFKGIKWTYIWTFIDFRNTSIFKKVNIGVRGVKKIFIWIIIIIIFNIARQIIVYIFKKKRERERAHKYFKYISNLTQKTWSKKKNKIKKIHVYIYIYIIKKISAKHTAYALNSAQYHFLCTYKRKNNKKNTTTTTLMTMMMMMMNILKYL